MEAIGVLLALAGMALFVTALLAAIRPMQRLHMGTRKRAALGLVLSFVLFGVGGSLLPEPKNAATGKDVAAAMAKVEPKADPKARKDAERKLAADQQAARKADVLALWNEVLTAAEACDRANTAVVNSLGKSSIYEAYGEARSGASTCRQTQSALGGLEPPESLDRTGRAAFEDVLENCSNAYLMRQTSLNQLQEVLDGDMKPSSVQEFGDRAKAAQAGVLSCVAGFMSNGMKIGLTLAEFERKKS